MTKNFKLTEEQVRHVAKLARLDLTDAEVQKFQKQLSDVLAYFEVLKEVETKNVEPTSQVTGLENEKREDRLAESLFQQEALSGTSNPEKGMFKVKAIFG